MASRNVRRTACLAAAALFMVVAALVPLLRRGERGEGRSANRPDPRRAYAGPLRNIDPAVAYVADDRCAECHATIAATYAEHPMGRSLVPADRAAPLPCGTAQHNPFDALGTQMQVAYAGNRLRQTRTRRSPAGEPAAEQTWQVDYVIGSGTRGFSYLSDRDGFLFQTPVSWYAQKKQWDLSPGFGTAEAIGRAIGAECLFCHANRAHDVAGTVNRFTRPVFDGHAIGCQRCHGPGALHVAGPGRGADGTDPTIVHPGHLTAELRQAICEQCHLQGASRLPAPGRDVWDFRPGLPLEAFWSVYVPAAAPGRRAVGQVEQMYQSRCYRAGSGRDRLGCVSCHDPHERVPPERRAAHYRARCLRCHEPHGCRLPRAERLRTSADDSCIACHMPNYGAADIPHTAVTDHRIPRGGGVAPGETAPPPADGEVLVSFFGGRPGLDAGDDARGRAMALTRLARAGDVAAGRAARHVLPALDEALRRDPDDLPAGEARGYALALRDEPAEALAAFRAVLERAPERESALVGAALTAEGLGRAEATLDYWRRAAAVNPQAAAYHRHAAKLLLKREAWAAALPVCDGWVRLDPFSADARAARVACLLGAGDPAEARAEFARIEALAPANLRELQIRFGRKLKLQDRRP